MGIIENRDAQFMLLAGFIIAIGLVITTVMLNSVIFEFNIAMGAGNELSKDEIVNLILITKDETRNAYRDANASGGIDARKISNFSNQTRNFSANLPKIYALHGEGVNVSLDTGNWNVHNYANFTDNGTAGGTANWTVMESINSTSLFELRNITVNAINFEVNVSNQANDAFLWSMKLTGSGGVTTSNYSGTVTTFSGIDYSYINILDPKYNFSISTGSNSYKVSFINGAGASGRFNITGNTTYGRNFTRAHDYVFNYTVTLSTSKMQVNITIPVSVPW